MTYEAFNHLLAGAGISIREFALRTKMKGNSVTNYARRGEVPTHLAAIAVLMAKLEELNIDTKELLARAEIGDGKRPRGAGIGKFGGSKQVLLFTPRNNAGLLERGNQP